MTKDGGNNGRPLPIPDRDSVVYWKGCKEHKLVVPRCTECGLFVFPSRIICPRCLSDQLEWVQLSGLGTVYSFTVVHRGPSAAFKDKLPYVMALVDLDEGPRMLTNIVGTESNEIRIGMRVRCVFDDVTDDVTLPLFTGITEA